MLYRIKLPKDTYIISMFTTYDHWVSLNAKDEMDAKIKALHKLAYQIKNEECKFFMSDYSIKDIRHYIDLCDMEVYK